MKSTYDLVVIGGGHAGIEAALAGARLGARTALVTHSRNEIGRLPCNPAIGGLGKGHLVREVDALGGEMGRAIDATGIQFRLLNRRKGPAVQSPRAQADKDEYQKYMMEAVLQQDGLDLIEDEAVDLDILWKGETGGEIRGVATAGGRQIRTTKIIICTGTFLRGLMHVGDTKTQGGREGAASSVGLSESLARVGLELRRLKTGTPPRIDRDSVDYGRVDTQRGDEEPVGFSLWTDGLTDNQVNCYITNTNTQTHDVIRSALDRSPLYQGVIKGQGPRYCPSIEDKIVRFSDREGHRIFLEPEGRDSREIYVNGFSTSLPADVQKQALRLVEGLGGVRFIRYGYAVEYDSVPSFQVKTSLESKRIAGLYMAGQILGTSGYEEAAAQGLLAGVNCVRSLNNSKPTRLSRHDMYMGVLVDDLCTKEISEPYRMFTSRAENRLHLRCDNVEKRMMPYLNDFGIVSQSQRDAMVARVTAVDSIINICRRTSVDVEGGQRLRAADYIKRPEANLETMLNLDRDADGSLWAPVENAMGDGEGRRSLLDQAQNELKYEGYVARQKQVLEKQDRLSVSAIPDEFSYENINAISCEAREKLEKMRPQNLQQAGKIDGVRAGDIAVLSVLIERFSRKNSS